MKTFTVSPEVEKQLQDLLYEFHSICDQHSLPHIFGVVTSQDNGSADIISGGYFDSDNGLAPTQLVAAHYALNASYMPEEMVDALARMQEDNCQCDKCKARRAEGQHSVH